MERRGVEPRTFTLQQSFFWIALSLPYTRPDSCGTGLRCTLTCKVGSNLYHEHMDPYT